MMLTLGGNKEGVVQEKHPEREEPFCWYEHTTVIYEGDCSGTQRVS